MPYSKISLLIQFVGLDNGSVLLYELSSVASVFSFLVDFLILLNHRNQGNASVLKTLTYTENIIFKIVAPNPGAFPDKCAILSTDHRIFIYATNGSVDVLPVNDATACKFFTRFLNNLTLKNFVAAVDE